jgi:hypothetical protein
MILGIANIRSARNDWSLWHLLLDKCVGTVLLLLCMVIVQYADSMQMAKSISRLILQTIPFKQLVSVDPS